MKRTGNRRLWIFWPSLLVAAPLLAGEAPVTKTESPLQQELHRATEETATGPAEETAQARLPTERDRISAPRIGRPKLRLGMEYLEPTAEDRRLDTTSIDLLFPFKSYEKLRLTLLAGLTATQARGEITQLTGELEEGTLEAVTYESPGTGIGPSFLATYDVLRRARFSASLDAGGAVILYDKDFPAGGDRYNFMWRLGPSLSYRVADSYVVGVSYRWMHVSNGKGLSSENPSYEAAGLSLQVSYAF